MRSSRGRGPVRTGVTVVLPHEDGIWSSQVFAGCHRLNGNGEMTGLVVDPGMRDADVADRADQHPQRRVWSATPWSRSRSSSATSADVAWGLPVVAETWDGVLNDCNGFHVRPEHLYAAIADATSRRGGWKATSDPAPAWCATASRVASAPPRG
ncbi:MAG: P1 family peptidase [Nocardioidaceae bacterium]